jgi:hypothetical protein
VLSNQSATILAWIHRTTERDYQKRASRFKLESNLTFKVIFVAGVELLEYIVHLLRRLVSSHQRFIHCEHALHFLRLDHSSFLVQLQFSKATVRLVYDLKLGAILVEAPQQST